jgi:hypothetical protein
LWQRKRFTLDDDLQLGFQEKKKSVKESKKFVEARNVLAFEWISQEVDVF